jgi:flagellar protein FlaG
MGISSVNINTANVSLDSLAVKSEKTYASPVRQSIRSVSESGASEKPKGASSEEVSKAVEAINKELNVSKVGVEFSVDKEADRTIVKVVDTQTKDVIRQIPNEEVLEISKSLEKIQGLLVRQKA